jgi:hypothetical protein
MQGEPTVLLGVKMPVSLRQDLAAVAKQEERSASAITRLALRQYFALRQASAREPDRV